jgi:tRNA(His) 5'-end guanylyltransferase
MTDKLGDRIKEFYENRYRNYLPRRMPAIIRIDGKAFHSFTKGFKKPFDLIIRYCMTEAATELCKQIQGAKIGYVQSDEISILVTDYDDLKTDAWFDKNIQKVSSISASITTIGFNKHFNWVLNNYDFHESPKQKEFYEKKQWTALFDSRCFVLPKEEVVNYFIWRQNDATRNAIQGLGQEHFSAKQCKGVDNSQMQEKLFQEKQINFNDEPTFFKRGWTIVKKDVLKGKDAEGNEIHRNVWEPDYEMPILTTDRNYIQKYV